MQTKNVHSPICCQGKYKHFYLVFSRNVLETGFPSGETQQDQPAFRAAAAGTAPGPSCLFWQGDFIDTDLFQTPKLSGICHLNESGLSNQYPMDTPHTSWDVCPG